MAPIFNQALKAGHVGFVTYKIYTMYKQQSIKSQKRLRNILVGGGVLYQYKWQQSIKSSISSGGRGSLSV